MSTDFLQNLLTCNKYVLYPHNMYLTETETMTFFQSHLDSKALQFTGCCGLRCDYDTVTFPDTGKYSCTGWSPHSQTYVNQIQFWLQHTASLCARTLICIQWSHLTIKQRPFLKVTAVAARHSVQWFPTKGSRAFSKTVTLFFIPMLHVYHAVQGLGTGSWREEAIWNRWTSHSPLNPADLSLSRAVSPY